MVSVILITGAKRIRNLWSRPACSSWKIQPRPLPGSPEFRAWAQRLSLADRLRIVSI